MFPISARTVLENLLTQAEVLAKSEFRGLRGAEVFQEVVDKDPSALSFQWASAEALTQARKLTDDQGDGVPFDLPHMTTRQEQVMSNWFRVRAMLQGFVDKHDEDRILMFLTAASHGNTTLLQKVMLWRACEETCTNVVVRCCGATCKKTCWHTQGCHNTPYKHIF